MISNSRLQGVIVPMVTPFTVEGALDERAAERIASRLAAHGLGVFVLGTTGEGPSMTPAQRQALPAAELDALRDKAIHLGLDLQGGMHLVLEIDRSRLSAAEAKDAPARVREILNNRIDQFGVAEPLIQLEGEDRIAIQLPGLTDRERARDLIGKTALLEFKLLRPAEEVRTIFQRLDSYLATRATGATFLTDLKALLEQPLRIVV